MLKVQTEKCSGVGPQNNAMIIDDKEIHDSIKKGNTNGLVNCFCLEYCV